MDEEHPMVVDSQKDTWESDDYKEERDDDLEIDDEVHEIMDFVFRVKSDPEETYTAVQVQSVTLLYFSGTCLKLPHATLLVISTH